MTAAKEKNYCGSLHESRAILSLAAVVGPPPNGFHITLQLNQNSRQGVRLPTHTLQQGFAIANSTTALGMRAGLCQNRDGSLSQSWNRYAYVANNPTNAVDPDGLMMNLACPMGYCGGGGMEPSCLSCGGGLSPQYGPYGPDYDSQGNYYGPTSEVIAEGLARHDSIVATGFDPACNCYLGSITTTFENDYVKVTTTISGVPDALLPTGLNGTNFWYQASESIPVFAWDANSKFKQLEKLVMVFDGTKQPLYNIVTSAGLFTTGALMVGGAVYFTVGACVGSGGLACGAAIYGGVHVAAGGVVLIRGGYQFTRNVTIPSLKGGRH